MIKILNRTFSKVVEQSYPKTIRAYYYNSYMFKHRSRIIDFFPAKE